jgi:hypothetical protein
MIAHSNRISFSAVLCCCAFAILSSCKKELNTTNNPHKKESIKGTWKLLTGTIIHGKDTTVTDYTMNLELIKIINDSHFAFLKHDLGKDSTKVFVSGGGRSSIHGNIYTEYLDFCNYREWENNKFEFDFKISNDTLITKGVEKVEAINVNRLNIEKYVRVN